MPELLSSDLDPLVPSGSILLLLLLIIIWLEVIFATSILAWDEV